MVEKIVLAVAVVSTLSANHTLLVQSERDVAQLQRKSDEPLNEAGHMAISDTENMASYTGDKTTDWNLDNGNGANNKYKSSNGNRRWFRFVLPICGTALLLIFMCIVKNYLKQRRTQGTTIVVLGEIQTTNRRVPRIIRNRRMQAHRRQEALNTNISTSSFTQHQSPILALPTTYLPVPQIRDETDDQKPPPYSEAIKASVYLQNSTLPCAGPHFDGDPPPYTISPLRGECRVETERTGNLESPPPYIRSEVL